MGRRPGHEELLRVGAGMRRRPLGLKCQDLGFKGAKFVVFRATRRTHLTNEGVEQLAGGQRSHWDDPKPRVGIGITVHQGGTTNMPEYDKLTGT